MAYLARIDMDGAQAIALPAPQITESRAADFTPLEWSVIRLTRMDPLWTVRPRGPIRRFFNWLAGRANPQLANERLETLRRLAVLSRLFGFTVDGSDVRDFLAAGFTADQYELLVASVRTAPKVRTAIARTEAMA